MGVLQSKTGSYGTVSTDGTILMNSASASALTLNTSGLTTGQTIRIKNINTGTVTITPSSGTIDGSASVQISIQYEAIEVVWDGSNFWII
jgi:paraquat-inducible protein B